MKKTWIIVCMVLVIFVALGAVGLFFTSRSKDKSVSGYSVSYPSSSLTSSVKLYSHHFDVVFETAIGTGTSRTNCVWTFNFNCMSNNSTRYKTLGDLEGDGYIVSAFGQCAVLVDGTLTPVDVYGECRTVHEGTVFYYYMDLTQRIWGDDDIHFSVQLNMADFEVQDSVSRV